ncbi:protein amnionless-like [Saccoglossus kowalevskii]
MTLPGNGVITLSSNMILSFSDKNTDKSCNGEDVEFTRGASKDWFNPFNWNATDDTVLVETENIPCQYDNVIFPEGGKYYIRWMQMLPLTH